MLGQQLKIRRHQTKTLRQSRLLPPTRCPLVVSLCMKVTLLVGVWMIRIGLWMYVLLSMQWSDWPRRQLSINRNYLLFWLAVQGTRHAEFLAINSILKNHPPSILRETSLYVTVEPCIMCASALRQFQVKAVYYGCSNDRFGGTGGVLSIHSEYAEHRFRRMRMADSVSTAPVWTSPSPYMAACFEMRRSCYCEDFTSRKMAKA